MPVLAIPYTFVNGTIADATQVNANFNAVTTIVNGIDNQNIGPNGLFASQIIPTTTAQATFGGLQNYTFPNSLTVGTNLTVGGTISTTNLTVTGSLSVTNLVVNGGLQAIPGPIVSASSAGVIPPAYGSPGDLIAIASNQAGRLVCGGANSAGILDWNVSNSGRWTFTPGNMFFANLTTNGIVARTSADPVNGVLNLQSSAGTISLFRLDDVAANSGYAGAAYVGVSASATTNVLGRLMPWFTSAGGQMSTATFHANAGTVTATSTTTTVTNQLPGSWANNQQILILIFNNNTGALVTSGIAVVNSTTFQFASTSGQSYTFIVFCVGG